MLTAAVLSLTPLLLLAVGPAILFWARPAAAWRIWLAFAAAQVAFCAILAGGHWPAPPGVHYLVWPAFLAGAALLATLFFRKFFSPSAAGNLHRDQERAASQALELVRAQEEFSRLKGDLTLAESRLQESLKFYATVRNLAECVDFDDMKKVLERELKTSMPHLAGFALFVRDGASGRLELKLQHLLWINDVWAQTNLEPRQREAEPSLIVEASGKTVVAAPIHGEEAAMGFFVAQADRSIVNEAVKNEMLVYMRTLAEELRFGILKAASFAKVQQLSRVDGLTGVFRRGVFDQRLNEEVLRGKTFKTHVGLMLLDIDHFKSVNDKWGHPFGDTVLRRVAQVLRTSVYETDLVARYGGEEFGIILPRSDEAGAFKKAEKLRLSVEQLVFQHENHAGDIRCAISIGLAFFPQDAADPAALIQAADQALYHSKETGRNRVTCRSQIV